MKFVVGVGLVGLFACFRYLLGLGLYFDALVCLFGLRFTWSCVVGMFGDFGFLVLFCVCGAVIVLVVG